MYQMLFPGGRRRALTLSYDDGVSSDVRLISIMKKHGLKGTFNLNAGLMTGAGNLNGREYVYRLRPEEARAAYQGMEIAVHGYTHPFFEQLPHDRAVYEAVRDREALEDLAGYPVRGMAYPYGTYDTAAVEALRSCGVAYSRTVCSTHNFEIPSDWLVLHPTCHHDDPMLMELGDRFLAEKAPFGIKLFYVWGHSYEFLQKNNWHVIRDFCQKMSGKDDIWYATNIEIVDYINASRKLVSSADGKIIYNPTSTDIWADLNSQVIVIHAGETIHL